MFYTGDMALYMVITVITFAIAGASQWYVSHMLKKYSRIPSSLGLSGAQMAQRMIMDRNLGSVGLYRGRHGENHFNPTDNSVTLGPDEYNYGSITAIATAAHEVGHAEQYATGYSFMKLRHALVPVVNLASNAWMFVLLAGIFMSLAGLVKLAIILFAATLLFHLVTLPVEFDASRRGLAYLQSTGVNAAELQGASGVLRACALTYVAAALTSLLQLVYLIMSTRSNEN